MAHLPGKFVWFEYQGGDPNKAKAFYGELFGWTVKGMPMGEMTYEMISSGGKEIGGYAPQQSDHPQWHGYVSVADVDESVVAIKEAGGKGLGPAVDVPGVGRMAKLSDPQGATFSVYTAKDGDQPDGQTPAGAFAWMELWTKDAKAAVAFYEKALGFTHEDMDMGPAGTYHLLRASGAQRAGVMNAPDAKIPSMWFPYVNVEDCDRSVARAKKLGAKIVAEPTEVPNVGRFAIFLDPQGAAIAVMQPAR